MHYALSCIIGCNNDALIESVLPFSVSSTWNCEHILHDIGSLLFCFDMSFVLISVVLRSVCKYKCMTACFHTDAIGSDECCFDFAKYAIPVAVIKQYEKTRLDCAYRGVM